MRMKSFTKEISEMESVCKGEIKTVTNTSDELKQQLHQAQTENQLLASSYQEQLKTMQATHRQSVNDLSNRLEYMQNENVGLQDRLLCLQNELESKKAESEFPNKTTIAPQSTFEPIKIDVLSTERESGEVSEYSSLSQMFS